MARTTTIQDHEVSWNLKLYQSVLPSIHMRVKEELVILHVECKWRVGVHFGQKAAKNNDFIEKMF